MHTSKKNQNTEKQTQKNLKEKKLKKSVYKTLNLEQLDKVNQNGLEALTELSLLQSYFVDDNDTLLPSMISNNLIDLSEYDGNVVILTPMKQVCYISLHSFLPPFVKGGGGPLFQTGHVNGGKFFLKFQQGEQKVGGIQYFVEVQWGELVKVGQFFRNQLQK